MSDNEELMEYTIQPGDTFWDLADEFDTTVDDIMAANPDVDPDNLQVGQVIIIPEMQEIFESQRPGERRPEERRPEFRRPEFRRPPFRPFRRPVRRPFRRPFRPYYPYYPAPGGCPAGSTPYAVQPGDSLYSIAARTGVSVDAIIAVNPFINFGIPLQIGQVICLPF